MSRRVLGFAVVVAVFAVAVSSASGASDPRVPALQRKVAQLSSTVASLQTSVNGLSGQVNTLTGQLQSAQAQIQALSGSVQLLGGQVQGLNGAVGTANGRLTNLEKAEDLDGKFDLCEFALNTDNFHFTWEAINVVVKNLAGVSNFITYGGPVDDKGTCAALGIARSPKFVVSDGWSIHASEYNSLVGAFHHRFEG